MKKEIEMDYGFFLFNTVTFRIFGTQCYESIEKAKEVIKNLEEKWKENPKNRRNLEVVKVKLADFLDPRDESEKEFDKADEKSKQEETECNERHDHGIIYFSWSWSGRRYE
jgi:hypothetical protein